MTENRQSPDEAQDLASGDGIDQALHEMRDGLTVIHAYAQLLQRRTRPWRPVEQRALLERLEIIEHTSTAMESLLRQLDRHHSANR